MTMTLPSDSPATSNDHSKSSETKGSNQQHDRSKQKNRNAPKNHKNANKQQKGSGNGVRRQKFDGEIDNMNGHVFQCHGEGAPATQFSDTCKALGIYAGVNFKFGADIQYLVKQMKDKQFTEPNDPPTGCSKTKTRLWEKEVDEYYSCTSKYKQNKNALYAIIWAQCSNMMRSKLKNDKSFGTIDEEADCLALLILIKGISFKFETQGYLPLNLHYAKAKVYNCRQGKDETISDYYDRFRANVDVIEHYKGAFGNDPALVLYHLDQSKAIYLKKTHHSGRSHLRQRGSICI